MDHMYLILDYFFGDTKRETIPSPDKCQKYVFGGVDSGESYTSES